MTRRGLKLLENYAMREIVSNKQCSRYKMNKDYYTESRKLKTA